jgi:hypothetical protein
VNGLLRKGETSKGNHQVTLSEAEQQAPFSQKFDEPTIIKCTRSRISTSPLSLSSHLRLFAGAKSRKIPLIPNGEYINKVPAQRETTHKHTAPSISITKTATLDCQIFCMFTVSLHGPSNSIETFFHSLQEVKSDTFSLARQSTAFLLPGVASASADRPRPRTCGSLPAPETVSSPSRPSPTPTTAACRRPAWFSLTAS